MRDKKIFNMATDFLGILFISSSFSLISNGSTNLWKIVLGGFIGFIFIVVGFRDDEQEG